MPRRTVAGLAAAATLAVLTAPLAAAPANAGGQGLAELRVAAYNVSMFRNTDGELARDLRDADDEPQDEEIRNVAEIIQRERPDVLLLNEFDYDSRGEALDLFRRNFLEVGQGGAVPISYEFGLAFASNTGVPSGFDLNNDGQVGQSGRAYGDDSFGFGTFPGQYAFAVLSRYPIDEQGVRTFQNFRWKDMPGARLPDDLATPAPADWYSPAELEVFRLSSKNHVDVPILVGRQPVHLLASHPTPPTFDGPEDRNGKRNADEIRLLADYITPGRRSSYLYDDQGRYGGLGGGERFVIAGDLNADPSDGGSLPGAIQQVLEAPRVQDPLPRSAGAVEQARLQGGANDSHLGDPALDTADFSDQPPFGPGNLRVDYVLPSRGLRVLDAAVFWPTTDDPLFPLVGTFDRRFTNGFPSSDHRLVRVDLAVPGAG